MILFPPIIPNILLYLQKSLNYDNEKNKRKTE